MIKEIFCLVVMLVANVPSALSATLDSYVITGDLDLANGALWATTSISYKNDSDVPITELRFRLDINLSFNESMQVDNVKDVDGRELPWSYETLSFGILTSDKGQMVVNLPEPLAIGDTYSVEITFSTSGRRFIGPAMTVLQDDPFISMDAWYPKAMSYMGGSWSLDDRRLADYLVTLTMPESISLASTGAVFEEQSLPASRKRITYVAEKVRGFTLYGSTFWEAYKKKVGDIDVIVYSSKLNASRIEDFQEAIAASLTFYQEHYFEYQSQTLSMVCVDGLGHGSFACCNVIGLFIGGRNFEEQYRWLIAHEVAHQYFGNIVIQPRNEIPWIWIGLGMIMDRHFVLSQGLDDQWHTMVAGYYPRVVKEGRATRLTQDVEDLIKAPEPWSYQWNLALAHGKGFAVCRMLEDLLGEEKFRNVIRTILADSDGMTNAGEFIDVCQQEYGESLDWFAQDWIYNDRHLDYSVESVTETDGGWLVTVNNSGEAAYPAVVALETDSGETILQKADRTSSSCILRFETAGKAVKVVIDPDNVTPDLDRSNNIWNPTEGTSESNETHSIPTNLLEIKEPGRE